jgi:hypothetical protein
MVDAFPDRRINNRIQSGAIAAAGQQSNSHREFSSQGFTPLPVYRGAVNSIR